jgi:methylglyoxal synthase
MTIAEGGHPMSTLALIAHDNKKVDLLAWATFNREMLSRFELIATRHTARLLERKVGLALQELLSGAEGGDAQIAALTAVRAVDAVFFLVDPLSAQAHDPDVRALMRVCNVHNVPLATNLATADLIITALANGPRPRVTRSSSTAERRAALSRTPAPPAPPPPVT